MAESACCSLGTVWFSSQHMDKDTGTLVSREKVGKMVRSLVASGFPAAWHLPVACDLNCLAHFLPCSVSLWSKCFCGTAPPVGGSVSHAC